MQNNLTQTQLAEMTDVTDKYISLVETGRTKISLPRLSNISTALGVDITVFLKDVDDNSANYINNEICEHIEKMKPELKNLVIEIIKDINNTIL